MKITSLKKSALVFSLVVISTYSVVVACADWFIGYDYDSSFTPETYVDESYSPLFFSSGEIFYRIEFDTEHVTRFNKTIVSDWSEYLKGKINEKDLTYLLLNDSASEDINALYNASLKKSPPPAAFSKLNVSDEKVKGFVRFMFFAKMIESSSATVFNSWDYDEAKETPVVDPKVIAQVEKLYTGTSDAFLKNRFWFQTMKANFYSSDKQNAVTFFEKTKNDVPKNTLYYRGLSYVAGAHFSKENFATSNYLYSIVFDKCPELRTVTAYSFNPKETVDFNASLALTKTPEEKAALWALFGYYADEKTAIREIYKISPASPHLEYLLTRLVNKEEAKLNDGSLKSAIEYKKAAKEKTDKDALQLVTSIAKEGKTAKPSLWNTAAGYLSIFSGNYADADQFFEKGAKQTESNAMARNQLRLLKLINAISSTVKMDDKAERKLLPELTWLYTSQNESEEEIFRYHHAVGWSKQYIASLYKAQFNIVMAELFNRDEKFYRSNADLEVMKTFLSKPAKSEWENLAVKIYDITLSDIYEYQAVMSAYQGRIDDAIVFMQQSDGKDTALPGNPFNGKIKDCHDCDHAAIQKVKYTKVTLLQKMKEMQAHVDAGEDIYNNGLLLANAYYNISYFGNAREFYSGSIMAQESNYISPYYQPKLLSCSRANEYYLKAFNATTNAEQKAKCVYMVAKCERNAFYTKEYHSKEDWWGGEPEVSFLAWEGFKKLKAEYSNTKYYKEVINECGYFQKYLGQ